MLVSTETPLSIAQALHPIRNVRTICLVLTISQVKTYYPQIPDILLRKFCCLFSNIRMRNSMKSITPNFSIFVQLIRYWIPRQLFLLIMEIT
jgi:hypothetical protein